MSNEDIETVNQYLTHKNVSPLNTRAFKNLDGSYLVTLGSIDLEDAPFEEYNGKKFKIKKGEFSPFLAECNEYLREAKKYCAN